MPVHALHSSCSSVIALYPVLHRHTSIASKFYATIAGILGARYAFPAVIEMKLTASWDAILWRYHYDIEKCLRGGSGDEGTYTEEIRFRLETEWGCSYSALLRCWPP